MQVSNFSLNFCFYNSFATNKACGFECSQNTKTDGRQKWTFLQPHTNFFLILRRNEAERKHTAQINQLQYLFFTAYSFGMHATKGSTTNFSISKELQPISSLFLFVFLHLSSFLSAIENYRASTGLGLRANFCTLFLVRTCLKLPSPGHALRICLRHHFWTGLARLFRTIGIWMLKKSFFFELKIPVSFLFSM